MQILTDSLHRIAYATDASAYREMPLGVAYPKTEDDLRLLMDEARSRHTHLIPRAGGTSIAGQVVGSGIVVDVSRYMNRILEINAEERWVRVQPGVVRDELNLALKPYGLFFSPETSTSNRCCIGGMVGNNSCGTHSLVYGSTRHHVKGLRVLLADGSILVAASGGIQSDPDSDLAASVLRQLGDWQTDPAVRELLTGHFPDPSLRRRSCGYALDECLGINSSSVSNINPLPDLCALLTGSEGTLAFITEITLSLDPLPAAHKMVVCEMLDDLNDAWQANLAALQRNPVAVELIDGKILELARDNISARRNMEVLHLDPDHLPAAILVSEFWSDEPNDFNISTVRPFTRSFITLYDHDVDNVWALRKAGLGVLTGVESDAKPIGVIEDTAVAPERLGAYMHDFRQMMADMQLDCVYYGHISTGELHLRPILDIKKAEDRLKFREVAERTALLVRKHHGSLSGEHGDGRLRGEFIPLMYGDEVYRMFCTLKRIFDPDGIFNMGKIVNTPPMDEFLRYEVNQNYAGTSQTGLMQRIERCNGAGDCRKSNLIGGTMCPTYKVSGDELRTTRARANVLREKLTRDPKGVTSAEVHEVLDSCLACKGCRSECPSNVDMTRIRSEILQLTYDATHTPLRSWMVARMAAVEAIGSCIPRIYNFFAQNRLTSGIIKHILRFATERRIPSLSHHTMRYLVRHDKSNAMVEKPVGRVFLFADEFTNYQEAELGLRFARLLRNLGYEVIVPKHVESGRAAISKGCLRLAAEYAKRNIELLAPLIDESAPLVGIEPSCILSFRDEYPRLIEQYYPEISAMVKQSALAANALLFDEFLLREIHAGRIDMSRFRKLASDIWLHGHCHQKSLVGVEKTADILRMITTGEVHVIPSSCCGMAGSFGYEKEHYATSLAIGEMVLFPAVRRAVQTSSPQPPIVCAPGTSCREQILHGTGIIAHHPIDVLYDALLNN